MHAYRAFGLTIESELELPELPALGELPELPAGRPATPDVSIVARPIPRHAEESSRPGGVQAIDAQSYLLWGLFGRLLVQQGRRITVDAAPDVDAGLTRMIVLGRGIGVLLHQRGYLVLHASAVRTPAGAIAFVGATEAGKSTAAAALCAAGAAVVADDLLAVSIIDSAVRVHPGFAQLKLDAEPAVRFGATATPLPPLHELVSERYYPLSERFSAEPLPLARVYLVERAAEAAPQQSAVERLPPQQGCIELVRFTYAISLIAAGHGQREHFEACATVANQVPIARLRIPSSLDALATLAPQLL